MLASRNHFPRAVRFIRNLRGSSQPVLAQADDNFLYVAKFLNNPQGPNTLFNESAGSDLFLAFGLPTPRWTPLLITDSFVDRNRGCWLRIGHASVRPRAGLCFGSRYLSAKLFEVLPRAWFSHIANRATFWWAWVIDACANHLDNRQAVFAEGAGRQLTAWFIDHGHLFGGPNGLDRRPRAGFRYLDARVYPHLDGKELKAFLRTIHTVDPEQLRSRAQCLPADWKTASALKNFDRFLDDVADSSRLTDIANEMISFAGSSLQPEMNTQGCTNGVPACQRARAGRPEHVPPQPAGPF